MAVFDEDLAQASGGYESRETLHRICHLFAAKRVTFRPDDPTKVGFVLESVQAAASVVYLACSLTL